MDFEWNEEKNKENIRKHGFDFADALELQKPPMRTALDLREDNGEDRYVGTGFLGHRIVGRNRRNFSFYSLIISIILKINVIQRVLDGVLFLRNDDGQRLISFDDKVGKNRSEFETLPNDCYCCPARILTMTCD